MFKLAASRRVAAARWPRPQNVGPLAESVGSSSSLQKPEAPWRGPKYAKHDGPTPERYRQYRAALKEKHPEGWNPPKKLSREAMDGLRALHHTQPEVFTTPVLAQRFRISPEAVRRILKSKWTPSREREAQMFARKKAATQTWYEDKVRHEYEVDPQGDTPVRQRGDRLSLTSQSASALALLHVISV